MTQEDFLERLEELYNEADSMESVEMQMAATVLAALRGTLAAPPAYVEAFRSLVVDFSRRAALALEAGQPPPKPRYDA